MTAALTPSLALAYLSELSADIRAAIVLDEQGEALALRRDGDASPPAVSRDGDISPPAMSRAGDASPRDTALVAAARELLAEAAAVRGLTEQGGAFGARDDRHGVVVATGPLALPDLVVHDLRSVLAALGGAPPDVTVSEASSAAARALLDAL
jgi:hypothetical protein